MDKEDTKKVLKILSTAYRRYFADMSRQDKLEQVELYLSTFGEYPVEVVAHALHSYIKDNEYPPSIAGLQRQIDLLMPTGDNASDLWIVLAKACKHGSTLSQDEFDNLPKPIQAWCGNVAQIKELSQMDIATFNTVTRGQFLKTIPVLIERQKAQDKLPQGIKAMLDGAATKNLEDKYGRED